MSTRDRVRACLRDAGIRLKRRLGQSFLVDDDVLTEIARAAVRGSSTVIEIGAGIGTLTAELARRAPQVVAIERDRSLIPLLRDALSAFDNVAILEADALRTPFAPLAPAGERPGIAGNLPYSITSPLLMTLLEQRAGLGPTTVMIQREVAHRLAASPGSKDYGSLTVLFQLHAEIAPFFDVAPESFLPRPEVWSTVLGISWLEAPRVEVEDPIHFERVVRAAFSQRRKTLRNALSRHFEREIVLAAGKAAEIDLERRAETLGLGELARLAAALPPAQNGARG